MKKYIPLYLSLIIVTSLRLNAQNEPAWDNTLKSSWSVDFKEVVISSSIDGQKDSAFFYASKSMNPKPLIVSLHTWSGDYRQKDPITNEILARDWNYIHPNFRGANNKPEAGCSDLVLSDIEDAIQYALKNTNANPNEVHIIGVSGGGLATLYAYMNISYPVKSFSAWAPISDLEAWYWESVGRKQKYTADIMNIVSLDSVFNKLEARRRSPLFQKLPKELRKDAQLYIYEGVHDGYEGSVPITHSINMYNRVVGEIKYGISELDSIMMLAKKDSDLVAESEIISLVTKRYDDRCTKMEKLFDRNVYLKKHYHNVHLKIFDGAHEQLPQALGLIPYIETNLQKFNILTLGDSNGQNKGGWVDQLQEMLPESKIVNISKGGRTIGFDNLGREDLNALRNIDTYLDQAQNEIGAHKFDYLIVCLGTNDTKKVFENRQDEVVSNFKELLIKIKEHSLVKSSNVKLVYVTPPPIRTSGILEKYMGGNQRLEKLVPIFKSIAEGKDFTVVDVYHPLQNILDYYAPDGVHMDKEGQVIIGCRVKDSMLNN